MSLFLLPTFVVGIALAAPKDAAEAPSADAVRLLSRYGPGELPLTDPVLDALERIAEQGGIDTAPLLRSVPPAPTALQLRCLRHSSPFGSKVAASPPTR